MILKNLLQGRPLGHPLHPLLAHFPVGLLVLSLLFDFSHLFGTGNTAVRGAFYTMLAGLAVGLLAAVAGLADWAEIRADHPAKGRATAHMWLNLALLALTALNVVTRLGALESPEVPVGSFLLSLVGVGILSVSGYLGGQIVYDEGVGVGRHRRATALPDETVSISEGQGARPGQYVPVGKTSDLAEGESLRVEVAGYVAAVARVGGRVYAFQEFCTHRFGPLSEGSFDGSEARCPWHGSCFDMATGKVTRGPAKVDLKTFDVREQDGRIEVRVPEGKAGS